MADSIFGDLFYSGEDREILIAPKLGQRLESTRSGVHVIGDLTGTPLLKNILNDGAAVVAALADELGARDLPPETRHLVIVGAGPAGLSAALEAKSLGLSFFLIEQTRAADTIRKFHKNKQIFAEPVQVSNQSQLWLDECRKEELLDKWDEQVRDIEILAPVTMREIRDDGELKVVATDKGDYRCVRVLLAVGTNGNPRRLGIPGDNLSHVHTALGDPDEYEGLDIAVIGSGDAGVETALALCAHNHVTMLIRRDRIDRPKKRNRDAVHAAATEGRITIIYNAVPGEIRSDAVRYEEKGESKELIAGEVFLSLGTDLPVGMLRKLGIQLASDWGLSRVSKFAAFLIFVIALYLWKNEFFQGKMSFIPGGLAKGGGALHFLYAWIGHLPAWVNRGPSMIFGALYSVLVLGFGLQCIRKYRSDAYQVKRYMVNVFSQVVLLFLIPEVLFQGLLASSVTEAWRSYGLFMPAPLYVWNFWDPMGGASLFWLVWTILLTFAGIPIAAKFTGKKYCSWVCPCGCLAETFGDRWRHLAPRGRRWRAWEMLGEWVVMALVGLFVGIGVFQPGSSTWTWQKMFVDFLLAGVLGVGVYPFFGNRIWCRFFCPLSRCLHAVAGNISKVKISSGAHCIECGLCTKYCQMGIPVMEFARNSEDFDNRNSSCIQCGICVTVCPVANLQHNEWNEETWNEGKGRGTLKVEE